MVGMLLIFLTFVFCIVIFSGIGAILPCLLRLPMDTTEMWFLVFWVGWGATIAFLQIWHFAFPVNNSARLILITLGLLGLAWKRSDLRCVMVGAWRAMPLYTIGLALFLLLFGIWIANRSITLPAMYDAGYYHLQTVKWSSTYPVVPGLGLVHSRMAHGTAFFLYGALLDIGPWFERTYHVANGVIYWLLFSQLLISGTSVFRRKSFGAYPVMNLLFAMVVLRWITASRTLPSVSNDPAVNALGILLASQIMYLIEFSRMTAREMHYRVGAIVLLASVGVAIKFSVVALGGGLSLLALALMLSRLHERTQFSLSTSKSPGQERKHKLHPFSMQWKGDRGERSTLFRLYLIPISAITLITVSVFVPMMVRSVVMTGYPLYPLTIGAAPVDWRLPVASAQGEMQDIRWWTRSNDGVRSIPISDWTWVPPWFRHVTQQWFDFRLPLALIAASALLLLLRRNQFTRLTLYRWWIPAAAAVAVAYWFFTVPDLRFIGASFWVLAVGLFTIAVDRLPSQRFQLFAVSGAFIIIGIAALWGLNEGFWIQAETKSDLVPLHAVEVDPITTESGLTLWVPQEQENEQCWNAPLPCTPYPNPALRLRVEGELRHGFAMRSE